MTIDKIIVILIGFTGIVFVYWFFFMKKEKEILVSNEVDIIVEGGYSPNLISIKKGKITKLNFIRKDPNSCLEEVVLPDFRIKKYLPLNEKITIELNPKIDGEFKYSCGMNMYHGKIIVK